jgi:hypothetical protein
MLQALDEQTEQSYFEYVRPDSADAIPLADPLKLDVAILDMNHSWPNLGHDSLVRVVAEAARPFREELVSAGVMVRVVSFDVRRALLIPEPGRFAIHVGTGGPGHLDPRRNDGVSEWSQGIDEDGSWERPLWQLFDSILSSPDASLFAVCHTFGLLCRWSGVADAQLRGPEKGGKSSGMPLNVLSTTAQQHPWFSRFSRELPDGSHYRVLDNRLFDLVPGHPGQAGEFTPIGFERSEDGLDPLDALTMVEFARDGEMPRMIGMNHHPEIIDREHALAVMEEKQRRGEVSAQWVEERVQTIGKELQGEYESQSRTTSHYTLVAPLRHQIRRQLDARR